MGDVLAGLALDGHNFVAGCHAAVALGSAAGRQLGNEDAVVTRNVG